MSLHKAWLSSAVQGRHAMLLNSSNEAQEISNMDLLKMPLYALEILTQHMSGLHHTKNETTTCWQVSLSRIPTRYFLDSNHSALLEAQSLSLA